MSKPILGSFDLICGEDFSLVFVWKDTSGDVIDLTTWTEMLLTIRPGTDTSQSSDSNAWITKTITNTGWTTDGKVTFQITRADSVGQTKQTVMQCEIWGVDAQSKYHYGGLYQTIVYPSLTKRT